MVDVLNKVTDIGLALILMATFFATGVTMLANANTTGWDPNVKTIVTVVTVIIGAIAIALTFVEETRHRRK